MEDGTKKTAGAVGAAILALGTFAARFADDAARVGSASVRVADDVAHVARYGDDLAGAGGVADDLARAGGHAPGVYDEAAALGRGRTGASIAGAHFDDGLAYVDDPWTVTDEVALEVADDVDTLDALDVALDGADVALEGAELAADLARDDAPTVGPAGSRASVIVLDASAAVRGGDATVGSLAALDRALPSAGPVLLVAVESDEGVLGAPSEPPIAPAALLARVGRPAALVLCPAPRTTTCIEHALEIATIARYGDPRWIPTRLATMRDVSPSRSAITLRMLRRTPEGTRLVTSAPQ